MIHQRTPPALDKAGYRTHLEHGPHEYHCDIYDGEEVVGTVHGFMHDETMIAAKAWLAERVNVPSTYGCPYCDVDRR